MATPISPRERELADDLQKLLNRDAEDGDSCFSGCDIGWHKKGIMITNSDGSRYLISISEKRRSK